MYPNKHSLPEVPQSLNKYLVKRKGSFALQNAACTIKHSFVRSFWSRLHSLYKYCQIYDVSFQKTMLTTFTISNGCPTST